MNSELSKSVAGRVAEHGFWPAERRFNVQRDTLGPGDSWTRGPRDYQTRKFAEILSPERIKIPLVGVTMVEVVEELVDLLVDIGDLSDRDEVLSAIFSREDIRSTGVGGGFALPHAKTSQVSDLVMAVGVCAEAVDFGSVDDVGVRLVAMLIGPEEMTPRPIGMLAGVTGMMGLASAGGQLLDARSPEALYEIICRHEA
jgi:mannitol/fructose-specific phosphotransferase system IIA component (Ntr-type)